MDGTASDPHFDELYPALGRLVVNSSRLETCLRSFLCWLAGVEEAGVVFDGQSVEWMIASSRAVLGELKCTREFQLHDCDWFEALLAEAQDLNRQRNFFVHGDWDVEDRTEDSVRRPRNSPSDHRIFYVARSRLRKSFESREVAVVDVDLLADRMLGLTRKFRAAEDEGFRLRLAWSVFEQQPPMPPGDSASIVLDALRRRKGN
ncbi:hypothetical protein [Nocardia otitidiscaviarum]|uniref:hypothetical protein n=1 Tax=Nocardia otitidiscaviarum TaxID=1823 RepID=UPI0018937C69|nr:hypothetical protein [Nocardia otitidiscaviarum]MBF6177448.1 hypothetical protein [Nocardia otitidiscaviarum]